MKQHNQKTENPHSSMLGIGSNTKEETKWKLNMASLLQYTNKNVPHGKISLVGVLEKGVGDLSLLCI
jgi:hypothetical protein